MRPFNKSKIIYFSFIKLLNRMIRILHLQSRRPYKWCMIWLFLILPLLATASPNVNVTGTVIDSDGFPLIGVNVVVQGTTTGTTTDLDGKYSIEVPEDGVLEFTYIGFQTISEPISGRSVLNMTMRGDSELLDEVVVVGYGVQRKSDLTGSVAKIDGSDLSNVVVGNATSALQGRMAGIQVENFGGQPGGEANVFVRGVSSLTNSFPLYVIDGTFVESMRHINPKDIESIEVLKDASAAAIYGSRAANGVVLVTTKRGKAGAPRVSLDVRAGVDSPSKMLDYLDGQQFIQYRNQLEQNDGTGFVIDDPISLATSTDWQDLSLNSGGIQDYGLSVSGGGENSSYFISGNYFSQDGILVASGFERFNTRANSYFKIGKLTINQSLSLSSSELEENQWFGFEGSTAPILRENAPENEGGFEAPQAEIHNFGGTNKFGLATLEDNRTRFRNLLGNVNLGYEIVDGLTAKVNIGVDYLSTLAMSFRPTYFMSSTDAVNNTNDQNDLTDNRSESTLFQVEPTLNYANDFGKNRINAVVGFGQLKRDTRALAIYAQNLPSNDTRVIAAASPEFIQNTGGGNFTSALRSVFGRINYVFDDKYLITGTVRRDASSKFAEQNRVGVFPSFSIGWNVSNEGFWNQDGAISRLKLRAGFGELGSQEIPDFAFQSVFNLNSNTSFGGQTVPGFAQTSFNLENIRWETARTVNVGADIGFLQDKVTFSVDYFNKDVTDVLVGVVLPATSGTSIPVIQNVGEVNNRGLELEAAYRQSGNFRYEVSGNIAFIRNEVVSLPNPVIGPSTSEDLTRVNRFIEGQPLGVYWGFELDGVYADQAAIDNDPNIANDEARKSVVSPGDFIRRDITGDGIVDADDLTVLGDPTPDFTYGLNFLGGIGGFDFGLFLQGVQGNEIYNLNKFFNIFWADDNKLTTVLDGWTPENTNTDIPRATTLDQGGNREPSSFFVEDGSYLRLKALELGYSFDDQINADWLNGLRLFINAQNLFVLTSYSGYDPDVSSTNGGFANSDAGFFGNRTRVNPLLGRGLDSRAYPNARTLMFGVQATF